MPNPVSIIVWRDAEVDPRLFGDAMRLVLVRRRGLPDPFVDVETSMWWARDVARDCGNDVLLWAELPVVSDLTDEDVRQIDIILHALGAQAVYLGDPATRQPDLSEKFHAAAYGTQEDT